MVPKIFVQSVTISELTQSNRNASILLFFAYKTALLFWKSATLFDYCSAAQSVAENKQAFI
jgi:hypothetical protein